MNELGKKQKPAINSTLDRVVCSICIATYQRQDLLEILLKSLLSQDLSDGIFLEIIVVDNDSQKSALQLVKSFGGHHQRAIIKYYMQPQKNISLTRNMAVTNATGEYLLFIDDDEYASPQWVDLMLHTMLEHEADGVFGAKVPVFNEMTPKWMMSHELFYGSKTKTGEVGPKYTSSCILKASLVDDVEGPFDPAYGVTGGEDTHLFDRLEARGARFIFCQEAIVYEFLPSNRTTIPYLFFKGLRGGNTHTRRLIEFSGPWHLAIRLFMVSKGFVLGSVSFLVMLLVFPSKLYRVLWLKRFGSNIGRVLAAFDQNYQGYR